MHYDFAADPDKGWDCHNCERGDPDQLLTDEGKSARCSPA